MIVTPKTRGFICTTAHPQGCAENVRRQAALCKSGPKVDGAKKALILGASTGYGLASRIAVAFGHGAATLGVIFDKPASGVRTASAGWYNTAAFEDLAAQDGLYAKTINGDAFSPAVKQQVISAIKKDLGQVDLVVYSLAAPRRTMPDGVTTVSSVLKTTGAPYANKTIDLRDNTVSSVTIEPATQAEIDDTIAVMGGGDWKDWMAALSGAGVLTENAVTVAYSYIGPELTHPIYFNGSIGMAKKDLYEAAKAISAQYENVNAFISVNKALVTQSSAAIPIVPLYISILYKVMKEKGLHEGCIQQMQRLFCEKLYAGDPVVDKLGQIRLDDWEMQPEVQREVAQAWDKISSENVKDLADIGGYWDDFYQMFGFGLPGVDYDADQEIERAIRSIE